MNRIILSAVNSAGCDIINKNFPDFSINVYVEYKKGMAYLPVCREDYEQILYVMLITLRDNGHYLAGVDVYIVNDRTIAEINSEYLHCLGPTNILSFPGDCDMPGTLFLSVDTLFRESFLYAQPPLNYLLSLTAHGFGHLAGYDHGSSMDALSKKCILAARNCETEMFYSELK